MFLIAFSVSTEAAQTNSFDARIRDYVIDRNDGFVGEAMSIITILGSGRRGKAMAGMLPGDKARRKAYEAVIFSGISVNKFVGRKRPPGAGEKDFFTLDSNYHSFPSGYTSTSFALATIIAEKNHN